LLALLPACPSDLIIAELIVTVGVGASWECYSTDMPCHTLSAVHMSTAKSEYLLIHNFIKTYWARWSGLLTMSRQSLIKQAAGWLALSCLNHVLQPLTFICCDDALHIIVLCS
jgi:hypothetical protein